MEKIIKLIPASSADDINCKDGELESAFNFLFSDSQSESPSSPLSPPSYSLIPADPRPLPLAADFLAVFTPAHDNPMALLRLKDGRLARTPLSGDAVYGEVVTGAPPVIDKVVSVGDFIVVLSDGSLSFARWDGTEFSWVGEAPSAGSASVAPVYKALPPYSFAAGELPRMSVRVEIKDNTDREVLDWLHGTANAVSASTRSAVTTAVGDAFRAFLGAVEGSGLLIGRTRTAVAWRLPSGQVAAVSAPVMLPEAPVAPFLTIVSASCTDSVLYLSLEFNRAPFAVELSVNSPSADAVPEAVVSHRLDFEPGSVSAPLWLNATTRAFAVAAKSVDDTDFDPLPEVAAPEGFGEVTDIFSIAGRLFAVSHSEDGWRVSVSAPLVPFVPVTYFDVPFLPVYITHGLTSLTTHPSESLPPLLLFASDGIHQFKPYAEGYREARLVSRDVALGRDCFAPLPDGTAFLSPSGLRKVSGTAVKSLESVKDFIDLRSSVGEGFDASCRLMYLYDEGLTVVFTPGDEGMPSAFHYGWPYVYGLFGDKLGRVVLEVTPPPRPLASTAAVRFVTRPIKLGDPFAIKKLKAVELIWPDGVSLPVRVYGAMRLDKWYPLGTSLSGRMGMRGSGWRFYRLESYATPRSLPTLHLQ